MALIALVDDHVLLRKGLANLIRDLGHQVLLEADNGKDFIEKLNPKSLPDIVLLDITMPYMDGYETALWLKKNQPKVKVLALSMYDDESAVIRMLKNGARGYILKDNEPGDLKDAIQALLTKGFYHSELVSSKLIHTINHMDDDTQPSTAVLGLNVKEVEFLKWICTELTYKEIAEHMHVSPRTVDGYRDDLFQKLDIKSRVGLVLFAIKQGIVKV